MQVKSSAFLSNQEVPIKYTCEGENISPPLSVSGTPENAVSLALVMHDPDAPHGTFIHWVVWNISPDTTEILEGSAPSASNEGMNDFGISGYGGPCPPSGTHRYIWDIFALDTKLDLPPTTTGTDVLAAIKDHILVKAELVGTVTARGETA